MSETPCKVDLYVYDLSGGLARSMSQSLLGEQIDGVWHTSVVLRGVEYYFGGGINVQVAGTTQFGSPVEILPIGETFLDEATIEHLLYDLSSRYTPESYRLLEFNCNNFSDELCQLLTGKSIPPHITGLPGAVLSTPFGQMIKPLLYNIEQQMKSMRQYSINPPTHTGTIELPTADNSNMENDGNGKDGGRNNNKEEDAGDAAM